MIRLRRAEPGDVDFLVGLGNHPDVDPFLGVRRARDAEALAEQIERSQASPGEFGRFVIETETAAGWAPAGTLGFHLVNERSRIAHVEALALLPEFRGRGLADAAARELQRHLIFELGFHRLELECYAYNEPAIRHAERAGFRREGVKRKAYERNGEWVDSVVFAIVREDLGEEG